MQDMHAMILPKVVAGWANAFQTGLGGQSVPSRTITSGSYLAVCPVEGDCRESPVDNASSDAHSAHVVFDPQKARIEMPALLKPTLVQLELKQSLKSQTTAPSSIPKIPIPLSLVFALEDYCCMRPIISMEGSIGKKHWQSSSNIETRP